MIGKTKETAEPMILFCWIQHGHDTPESEQKPMVVMNAVEYVPQNTKIFAITGSGRLFDGIISRTQTYNAAGENKVHEL